MKSKPLIFCTLSLVFLFSCATKKEAVMPYYNFGYTSARLLPVSLSSADFEFRIWINNGTSIDRIISISKSKDLGDEASLVEVGTLSSKHKSQPFYRKVKVIPKSGIDGFVAKIDSLKLSTIEGETDSITVVTTIDSPFSLYVIELKENGKYHCFKFNTAFPAKVNTLSKYDEIQNLIFKEFDYHFYMK